MYRVAQKTLDFNMLPIVPYDYWCAVIPYSASSDLKQ